MAAAPITQDVMTIPRKLPEGPTNLDWVDTRRLCASALIARMARPKSRPRCAQAKFGSGCINGASATLTG